MTNIVKETNDNDTDNNLRHHKSLKDKYSEFYSDIILKKMIGEDLWGDETLE